MNRWWLVPALGVMGLVAACGVPTDGEVEVADRDEVPFGLLEPDRVPIAAPPPRPGDAIDVFLFDPDGEHLVPVTRRVDTDDPSAVVAELESGPSEMEASLGLQSALAEVEAVRAVEVDGSLVVVDLTEPFTELSGAEQRTAIAQLVFGLTGRAGLDQVGFTVEGESVEVPRGDGTLTGDPVERVDYQELAPP